MPSPLERPSRTLVLAELAGSTERLLASVRGLVDADLRGPSALPGWTRGHVVAHLARNADGLGNLATWAETGVETPMYASRDARAAEIEADAGRSLDVQLADVTTTSDQLAGQLASLGADADEAVLRMVSGAEIEGWEIALLRIREVEVHHVDLAAGYGVRDWAEPFCRRTLDQVAPGFAERDETPFGRLVDEDDRAWVVGSRPGSLSGPLPLLLGWLVGRSDGSGLVPAGRDDIPPAPAWS